MTKPRTPKTMTDQQLRANWFADADVMPDKFPPPEPKHQLAAARKRLKRERSKKRPPDVLARYEREVNRLDDWVKIGAPVSPAYVSFSTLDPITLATLVIDDTKSAPAADATSSINWPGVKAGISIRGHGVVVVEQLVQQMMDELVPPTGKLKVRLERALTELADTGHWTLERAKRYVILRALDAALIQAKQEWTGRIGATREGNVDVTGIPAAAGAVGYVKWLQQVVPEYARQELLGDIPSAEEADFPTTRTGMFVDFGETDQDLVRAGEETDAPDSRLVKMAQAVLTLRERTELPVFLADTSPELAESLCKMAGFPLSDKQRLILSADFESDQAISDATGIAANQIPVYAAAYVAKLAKAKVTPGKLTRKMWKKF
jgi:hypothetical protein